MSTSRYTQYAKPTHFLPDGEALQAEEVMDSCHHLLGPPHHVVAVDHVHLRCGKRQQHLWHACQSMHACRQVRMQANLPYSYCLMHCTRYQGFKQMKNGAATPKPQDSTYGVHTHRT